MRFSLTLAVLLLTGFVVRAQRDTIIIHFAYNGADIRAADAALLDSLALLPLRSIMLEGHADSSGSDVYNEGLSLRRATAVRSYLLSRGLGDSLFVRMEGFGRRRPYDAVNRNLNRRVVISWEKVAVTRVAVEEKVDRVQKRPLKGVQEAFKDTTGLVGKRIILRNVNFYGNRHIPLPSSFPEVNELLTVMKQHPHMIIRIQGYVCCMPEGLDGRDADNGKPLSVERAKYVYDLLLEGGVSKSRMSYEGFGGSNKLYQEEKTAQEQEGNRRVEILITRF